MAKGRLQLRLTPEALAELERRAGGKDKRQAYIEAWLTDASADTRKPASADEPATSFNDPARAERKQARKERKAALAQSVTGAVKENRKAMGDVVSAAFEAMGHKVVDVTPTHTFHSGAKPVAGCAECAAMVGK